eukprot:g20517.t1
MMLERSQGAADLDITHVYVSVTPGKEQEFKKATRENAMQSVKEWGNLRFDVLQSVETPTEFLLIEVYRTAGDAAQHKETKHYLEWRIQRLTEEGNGRIGHQILAAAFESFSHSPAASPDGIPIDAELPLTVKNTFIDVADEEELDNLFAKETGHDEDEVQEVTGQAPASVPYRESDSPPQTQMSPSHFGRQLLGLALQAPEVLQHPPSEGSRLHGLLDEDGLPACQPCAWFHKKPSGCINGAACKRCHLCPEGEPKLRKKQYPGEPKRRLHIRYKRCRGKMHQPDVQMQLEASLAHRQVPADLVAWSSKVVK